MIFILAFSLVFFVVLSRTEFFKYYLAEQEPSKESTDENDAKGKFLNEDKVEIKPRINPLSVLGQISLYAVSVYLIFAVTLACFPPLTGTLFYVFFCNQVRAQIS